MEIGEVNRTLDKLFKISEYATAHIILETRGIEAHDYCQKYLMPEALGKIIWHAILDDAIRMRKELELIKKQ